MHALNFSTPLRSGVVLYGAARVAALEPLPGPDHEEEDRTLLLLENPTGVALAHAPARLLSAAKVKAGCEVLVCGRVERLGEEPALSVYVLRRQPVEPAPGPLAAALAHRQGEHVLPLDLPISVAAYILWLIAHHLAVWDPARPSRLSREEVARLAAYLYERLPARCRTPLPPVTPSAPVSPSGSGGANPKR